MRLVAANLQPLELDDVTATSSIPNIVPKVRIDLVAASRAQRTGHGENSDAARERIGRRQQYRCLADRASRSHSHWIDRQGGWVTCIDIS
jgi:hypothetical protein